MSQLLKYADLLIRGEYLKTFQLVQKQQKEQGQH